MLPRHMWIDCLQLNVQELFQCETYQLLWQIFHIEVFSILDEKCLNHMYIVLNKTEDPQ